MFTHKVGQQTKMQAQFEEHKNASTVPQCAKYRVIFKKISTGKLDKKRKDKKKKLSLLKEIKWSDTQKQDVAK